MLDDERSVAVEEQHSVVVFDDISGVASEGAADLEFDSSGVGGAIFSDPCDSHFLGSAVLWRCLVGAVGDLDRGGAWPGSGWFGFRCCFPCL